MAAPLVFARASAALLWLASAALARDNVLLLIDESTDGRAYFAGQTPPMPIPNLQRLMREGAHLTVEERLLASANSAPLPQE